MADTASTFSEDTIDVLVSQLECPVCLESCTSPIFMCSNGHNVCSTCQPSLNTCPVCRVAGRPTNRNLFAEEFSQSEMVPCKNVEQGCKKVLKLKEMPEHLKLCEFGFKCMFEDCKWRGSVAALLEHAQSIHSEYVIDVGKEGVELLSDDFTGDCPKCGEQCGRPIIRTALLKFEQNYFWFLSEETVHYELRVQIRVISNAVVEPTHFYQLQFQYRVESETRTLLYSNKVRSLTTPAFSDLVFDNYYFTEYSRGYSPVSVLRMSAENHVAGMTTSKELLTFNTQMRLKSLPNWDHLDFVELGRGSNDRILTVEELMIIYNITYDCDDELASDRQISWLHHDYMRHTT